MRRRLTAATLAILLSGAPTFASDFTEAASRAVANAAAAQSPRKRGNDDSSSKTLGIVLLAIGGGILLYGATHDTGVECSSSSEFDINCGTTKSKATIITGAAVAGVGGFLLLHDGGSSPSLVNGRGGIGFRKSIRW
jgi:hypothetical protein